MQAFPIHVPRKHYGGSKPALRQRAADYNRDAAMLERYINDRIQVRPDPIQQYIYGFIAADVGLSTERVRAILFAVDCGHNGITVAKSAEALQAFFEGADGQSRPCMDP